jgi:hypothetical protein
MLLEELTAKLNLEARLAQALADQKKKKEETPEVCLAGEVDEQVGEEEEDEEDDEEDDEVDEEEFEDAVKLCLDSLDTLDRVLDDDRVTIPDGMRFLLLSRRIDLWDFVSKHADPDDMERVGRVQDQAEFLRMIDERSDEQALHNRTRNGK